MGEADWLAERFEAQRPRLRAVAYRMLGSGAEADDALQEAWLRLNRSDTSAVENMGGWLTTIVARVCLDLLRSRQSRREQLAGDHLPEPVRDTGDTDGPEQQALMADSVGLALLVVLDTLTPVERLTFVLHDMFDVPFDQIAPIVERSPAGSPSSTWSSWTADLIRDRRWTRGTAARRNWHGDCPRRVRPRRCAGFASEGEQ